MTNIREGSEEFAADVGRALRDNPLPVALIGAGIGWLLFANWRSGGERYYAGQGSGQSGAANDQSGMAGSVTHRAHGAYDAVRDGASGAMSSARHRAARLCKGMRHRARDWGAAAADRAQQAGHSFGDMVEDRPLLLGGAGLIIGAALGAALPRTRYEDEFVGETRDDLKHSVEEFGREQWDKAQRVVQRTVEAAREEAERQGLTMEEGRHMMDEAAEKARNVANAAAGAAQEAAGKKTGGGSGGGQQSGQGSTGGSSAERPSGSGTTTQ